MNTNLDRRNVTIADRRTSLSLETEIWDALAEICRREGLNLHQLCSMIDERRTGASRTSAVRSFSVTYFRMAATDDGHDQAGHGRMAGEMLEIGLPGRMAVTSLKRPDRIDLRRTVA
jgi:predicted DNA-binding ribbon-helix-helix protein